MVCRPNLWLLFSWYSCQCGHCNVPSSPLNSPVPMLPPFKSATSHTKVCSHASAAPTQNTAGKAQWTNPIPNFNPHLLVCNDLQGIPPALLPPPLMMNGLGSACHCPACSSTTGYRDGGMDTEQVQCTVFLLLTDSSQGVSLTFPAGRHTVHVRF